MADDFYVAVYANQLIGMFTLSDAPELTKELMYFYVEASFRGLGIGADMLERAKNIAVSEGFRMIILDTLTPNLNHFYENHGATIVKDGNMLGAPTTVLQISLKS